MFRIHQSRLYRKASRKAIFDDTINNNNNNNNNNNTNDNNNNASIIAYIRHYNRVLLGLICASLISSILLLFIGTYVYFDASIVGDAAIIATIIKSTGVGRTSTYDAILRLYGINETDFSVLYPAHSSILAINSDSNHSTMNLKLTNCKYNCK